jgi:hypothetical protein
MSLLSPPQIPLFRITLFYGPEAVEGASDSVHCVFNVKKRSWKGGVQVDVIMKRDQIIHLEEFLNYPSWLEEVLSDVPVEHRREYRGTGRDLLIQLLCFYKLQALIGQGIHQENAQISGDSFFIELNEVVQRKAEEIKRQISIELDLVEAAEEEG